MGTSRHLLGLVVIGTSFLVLAPSQAWGEGSLQRYLEGVESASESARSRALLGELAAQLESMESEPTQRYCGLPLVHLLSQLDSVVTPDGRLALGAAAERLLARPALDTFFDSPDAPIRVHYSRTGADSVGNATSDTAADGVPTYVHETANALALSWQLLVDTLGFTPPLSDSAVGGGQGLVDCYLYDPSKVGLGNFVIGVSFAETVYQNTSTRVLSATAYLVIHPTMDRFSQLPDKLDLLRITAAHEFFHTLHFSLDLREKPPWQRASWWWEGNAVWFEDYAFPSINDWSNLPPYLSEPERSITNSDFSSDLHPYGGGSMWSFHLVESFNSAAILRDIWARCATDSGDNTFDALDSELQSRGTSLEESWRDFAGKCMHTGSRWDTSGFSQGAAWPNVTPVTTLFNYPRAAHFTTGSDNLDGNLHPSIPVVTIGPGSTPLEGLAFAPVAYIPFPSNRSDSAMSVYVDTEVGLPVSFLSIGLDTTLGSTTVFSDILPVGDTTVVPYWLRVDTLFVVATSGVHYDPGASTADPLASATAVISAALDSAGTLAQSVSFAEPFPNPFDTKTALAVEFQIGLPDAGTVWLDVFNVSGDRVRSMETQGFAWPPAQFAWDGRNDGGQKVAGGLYLCKVTVELAGGQREEKLFRVGIVR